MLYTVVTVAYGWFHVTSAASTAHNKCCGALCKVLNDPQLARSLPLAWAQCYSLN